MKNFVLMGIATTVLIAVGVTFAVNIGGGRVATISDIKNPTQIIRQVIVKEEVIEERRDVGPFTELSLRGSGNVNVKFGAVPSVVVRAPKSAMEHVRTDVHENKLELELQGSFNIAPVEYDVTVPSLEAAQVVGSGDMLIQDEISSDEFKVDIGGSGSFQAEVGVKNLSVNIAGSGDATIKGIADQLSTKILGSGDLHGENLSGTTADIVVMGSGDIEIGSFEELNTTIAGSGDVKYSGNPRIKSLLPGSGKLIQR